MSIKYHYDLVQGTEEWFRERLGKLTASEMKNIITPSKFEVVKGVKDGTHPYIYEIVAQRITDFVEPHYEGFDMQRGKIEEVYARQIYSENYAPASDCGFVTNDKWGFTIGYSPDALIGDEGLIEIKSRNQKHQTKTIIENVLPDEFSIQIQTALLITERKFCDFISYSNGMPMFVLTVLPNEEIQEAIIKAASEFEEKAKIAIEKYHANSANFFKAERREFSDLGISSSEEKNDNFIFGV